MMKQFAQYLCPSTHKKIESDATADATANATADAKCWRPPIFAALTEWTKSASPTPYRAHYLM